MGSAISLVDLPTFAEDGELVQVVVEAPKGSRSKLKYDETLGIFRLRKILPLGAAFPYDFGFVPSTRGEDGDPLDVMVLSEDPLFPGCVLGVRLIGVIEAEQIEKGKSERNDRLIACLETPYNPAAARSIDEIAEQQLDELEHFFVSYNEAEGREFKVLARRGPEAARRLLDAGRKRHAAEARSRS